MLVCQCCDSALRPRQAAWTWKPSTLHLCLPFVKLQHAPVECFTFLLHYWHDIMLWPGATIIWSINTTSQPSSLAKAAAERSMHAGRSMQKQAGVLTLISYYQQIDANFSPSSQHLQSIIKQHTHGTTPLSLSLSWQSQKHNNMQTAPCQPHRKQKLMQGRQQLRPARLQPPGWHRPGCPAPALPARQRARQPCAPAGVRRLPAPAQQGHAGLREYAQEGEACAQTWSRTPGPCSASTRRA